MSGMRREMTVDMKAPTMGRRDVRGTIVHAMLSLCLVGGCTVRPDATQAGKARNPIERVDSGNGLTLRLVLDRDDYMAGEWITATATIENTSAVPLAIHYLSIAPMQVAKDECSRPQTNEIEMSSWRYAYCHPIVLDWSERLFDDRSLSWMTLPRPETEVKQAYERTLAGAKYGDYYPSYAIPPLSRISSTMRFRAKPGIQYIDAGIFSLKDFYSLEVLSMSGKERRSGIIKGVKYCPQIWMGCLYVKIDLEVK